MIIDGKAIAASLLTAVADEVSKLGRTPTLAAVTCAPAFETRTYLEMKRQKAASVGIGLTVVELPATVSTEETIACVTRMAKEADGIVVQLPLPAAIDRDAVLAAVPAHQDPDGFTYGTVPTACLPPVVGAIDTISDQAQLVWTGKRVVILGDGRLVGRPAAHFARTQGAEVSVYTKETFTPNVLQSADIIISGVGQSNLITPAAVQPGVVVFDAGTSEDGGVLVGDADPAVADQAALFTPVPGGIGPITIAYLLRNLVHLARQ